jgi:hypothetical protein
MIMINASKVGLLNLGWMGTSVARGVLPSGNLAVLAVVVSLLTMVLSTVAAIIVLVRLPTHALIRDSSMASSRPWTALGLLARIGRNALGWLLVATGLILSIPGVPGQGLLTIFAGLLLVDFPGRHRLIRRILSRPRMQMWVNRLRAKFGQPPLQGNPE